MARPIARDPIYCKKGGMGNGTRMRGVRGPHAYSLIPLEVRMPGYPAYAAAFVKNLSLVGRKVAEMRVMHNGSDRFCAFRQHGRAGIVEAYTKHCR